MSKKFLILLFLGLLVRLLLIPQPGFEADVAYWKAWSLAAEEKGPVWLTQNTNYNYPSGFTLVLWLIGKAYRLFANPDNFADYWRTNNFWYLFSAKLPSIIADLALAYGLYWLLRRPKLLGLPEKISRLAPWLAGIYLFHPVVLYDGAWWGQVDSLGAVFALFTLIFLFQKKPILASMILMTGFLLKLQLIIFLPLFFLYVWLVFSWQEMVKALAAAAVTFFVLSFPFFLAKDFGRTFILISQNADWFPLLSLRANNFWWLWSAGAGMTTSDKILTVGITQAKTLGLILFSAAYLLSIGLIFPRPTKKNLIVSWALAAFAFFLFPTQSHERYIFPGLILLLALIPYFWETTQRQLFLGLFILLSLGSFLNLNSSMYNNYPQNSLGFLAFTAKGTGDLLISAINLGLFAVFLWLVRQELAKIWFFGTGALIAAGLLFTNLNFLLRQPISLSKLKPIDYQQDYGSPQFNRSVYSSFGPKSWSFLSVNYFFYRKGIGTHANSKLTWDLAGHFRKFSTGYGIDSLGGEKASVVFEIWGDGKLLFQSPKIVKTDPARSVEIPVAGVKTLTLIVTDAGDGINGDHADWLEPKLYE